MLLHPLGLDHHCWDWLQIADAIAPDFPGHGARANEAVPPLEEMADDLAAKPWWPADVVGVSMGGVVAQHLALRHPRAVRSLVLACTSLQTDATALRRRAEDAERLHKPELAAALIKRWFPRPPSGRDEELAYVERRIRATDGQAMAAAWRQVARHDVVDRLSELSMPVSFVSGLWDAPPPHERAREAEGRIPHLRHVILECGHMPQLEIPDVFRLVIEEHRAWVDDSVLARDLSSLSTPELVTPPQL